MRHSPGRRIPQPEFSAEDQGRFATFIHGNEENLDKPDPPSHFRGLKNGAGHESRLMTTAGRERYHHQASVAAIFSTGDGQLDWWRNSPSHHRRNTRENYILGIKDLILVPTRFECLGLLRQGVRFNSLVPNIYHDRAWLSIVKRPESTDSAVGNIAVVTPGTSNLTVAKEAFLGSHPLGN